LRLTPHSKRLILQEEEKKERERVEDEATKRLMESSGKRVVKLEDTSLPPVTASAADYPGDLPKQIAELQMRVRFLENFLFNNKQAFHPFEEESVRSYPPPAAAAATRHQASLSDLIDVVQKEAEREAKQRGSTGAAAAAAAAEEEAHESDSSL
jgi:hypothetical protein